MTVAASVISAAFPFIAALIAGLALFAWLGRRWQASGRDGLAILLSHLDPGWDPGQDPRPIRFTLPGRGGIGRPRVLLQVSGDDESWIVADQCEPRELAQARGRSTQVNTLIRLRIHNPQGVRLLIQSGPYVGRAPRGLYTVIPHAASIAAGFRIHTSHPGLVQRMLDDILEQHLSAFAVAAGGDGENPLADSFRLHVGRLTLPPWLIRRAGGCFSIDGPRATYIEMHVMSRSLGWRLCAAADVLRDLARALARVPA